MKFLFLQKASFEIHPQLITKKRFSEHIGATRITLTHFNAQN